MTKGFFVTGIGTEVGKTVASAVLVRALGADYWKPVQSGDLHYTDSDKIRAWAGAGVHPEAFRLHTPASPHAAAAIDGLRIGLDDFALPQTSNTLIVEGAGGMLVPLNERDTMLDLIERLGLPVVLVSRHYLGSINHTLLSLQVLRQRGIPLAGLLFNGPATPATEAAITGIGNVSGALRLDELPALNREAVAAAADRLRPGLLRWAREAGQAKAAVASDETRG